MRARLICFTGRLRGQSFELEGEATIGRGIGNTIVLDDNEVSTEHAAIRWEDSRGCYVLEDLGSLNGTEVDGVRVQRPEALTGLHVITFAGDLDFVFQRLRPKETPDESPRVPAAAPSEKTVGGHLRAARPSDRPAAASTLVLTVETSRGARRFPLAEGEHVVGRADEAAIQLESSEISRRHARITVRGDRVLLADLGSQNHTFVDDRQLTSEVEVSPGARIRFGTLVATLSDGRA